MTPKPSSSGRRAFVLTAVAFVWSVALLVAAVVAPVYGSATLVDENGPGVLLVVAVPAVACVVVWLALWHRCSRGGRLSGYVAWVGVSVLGALCVVGVLTIGVFVLPVALLLGRAAALTPSGSLPGTAANGLG